jgi:hypothetical protein
MSLVMRFLLALLVVPGTALAQTVTRAPDVTIGRDGGGVRQSAPAPAAPQRPSRPWTVSVVTGVPSNAPLRDLERAMRETGFDLASGGCFFGLCFEPTTMPYSAHARAYRDSWTAALNRRIGPHLGVGVTGGRTLIGWTNGRHRGTGTYLEIETAMTHVAPLVTFTPTPGVRVGVGPGIFSTTFARTGLYPQPLTTTRRPGLLADASLTFPRRSRVFAELSAQQRWLGRQPLGPIEVEPDGLATFPQTQVRVTHWFIGLGAGVRF